MNKNGEVTGERLREIARIYNVSHSRISRLSNNRRAE